MNQSKTDSPRRRRKKRRRGLFDSIKDALDPDRALMASVDALIEAVAVKHALNVDQEQWEPGKALKLLLTGHVGTRNTGADVRVGEMIRQMRHVIGDDLLQLTICTSDPKWSKGYFRSVHQVILPQVFPPFLYSECPKHHGIIACEGSMFKSKFASALTCFMAGSLGMAAAERKLGVGYGAEAGSMTPALRSFVRRHCKDSLVMCRNLPSRDILGKLGVRTTHGADTAWTFDPAPPAVGRKLLREAGWDGEKKILAIAPINPFWWPVKPDLVKAAAHTFGGQYRVEHYKSIYFHNASSKIDQALDDYLQGIADAVNAFCRDRDVFVVLIGMEKLDRRSAERLNPLLDRPAPLFISDTYDMFEMISVLRTCTMLVSSRFHAIVCSMPGFVASAGVTMDERIRNIMNDRGTPDLFLEVDDPNLGDKLLKILHKLHDERDALRDTIGKAIPQQLKLMGQMGLDFMDEVCRVYPEFPRKQLPRTWEAHLPPMPPNVRGILEKYG